MSGVFGIVDPGWKTRVRPQMNRMAREMSHRDWYVSETYIDEDFNLAVGRIGIGIFNRAPQPVWNAAHTVALVMAGEFYNREALDGPGQERSDETLALSLYEEYGEEFARQVKGAFVVAVWDRARNRMTILNDRWGLYPLFYSFRSGRLVFAPEMKGVLCDPGCPKKLDQTALAQYMRFQQLLGERTFFEDIHLLPGASILIYDLSTTMLAIRPYWSFDEVPYFPELGFEDAVEEAGRIFRGVVKRLSGDAYRPGVFLSGGLDSRAILGLVERRPVASLTFGAKNSRDVQLAEKIARAAGSDHHWFDFPDGNWVKDNVDFHLELTEGFHDWIHMHGITVLPQARQLIDVNLTGWDGGTVFGHSFEVTPQLTAPVDDIALAVTLYQLFNQKITWPGLTEAEERLLYTDRFRAGLLGRAFDSLREELSAYLHYRQEMKWDFFFVRNHCLRMTSNMVTIIRSHIEVRFPFFDYDLFDFLYALPLSYRNNKRLYRALIQREMPHLAYIPNGNDAFLPTTRSMIRGAHMLAVKLRWRFNRHVYPLFFNHATLYADYENWLRDDLCEWAEGILFDQTTSERGIFDPVFLRSLMKRHLSNQEEWTIGKIAPIISYELMLRQFYDQVAVTEA